MVLWAEASDEEEKGEIIADIQEEIDQFEELPRKVVEKHGGINELSRLSGIPQPSLSRFFNSASMPRRTTL